MKSTRQLVVSVYYLTSNYNFHHRDLARQSDDTILFFLYPEKFPGLTGFLIKVIALMFCIYYIHGMYFV